MLRLTCAIPYGFTSPFPGTVEVTVLIVVSGGSTAASAGTAGTAAEMVSSARRAARVEAFIVDPPFCSRCGLTRVE